MDFAMCVCVCVTSGEDDDNDGSSERDRERRWERQKVWAKTEMEKECKRSRIENQIEKGWKRKTTQSDTVEAEARNNNQQQHNGVVLARDIIHQ